jgi:rubrerythrin
MVDEFGYLKYMHFLHNKKIRIVIEQVMNKENTHRRLCRVPNENTQASALPLSYALIDTEL